MYQEDSNGESSFEIIDKKNQLPVTNDKTESLSTLSNVSSPYSIPSPSITTQPGNLLSNVAPPLSIPDFTIWQSNPATVTANAVPPLSAQTTTPEQQAYAVAAPSVNPSMLPIEQFPRAQFSAAIPPSKGVVLGPTEPPKDTHSEGASGGFMGLFKDAFSSGGVFSKVAEKAKSSVDSIITTLDPQMSEYIYSGGDTEITVTSEVDDEVSAFREAFHSVFGKAWVNGIKLNLPAKKSQAIGFEAGIKEAEEKIAYSLKYRNTPTISIEDILFQQGDRWYGLSLLILRDAEKQITVQTFSQGTPVPVEAILKLVESSRPEWKNLSTEDKLASYVQANPDWQVKISGVPRKDVLLLAGKTLVRLYKNRLGLSK